jgi:tRNA dimethylallyltransferase
MRWTEIQAPLVVIVGPTAVGKTEVSLKLAESFGGEIISADSRLFYRGMDIGTAKPTIEERKRVPHHLIDVVDVDQTWSLGLFKNSAEQVIADIHSRGRLPFLVGGTGQYVDALLQNWIIPAQQPDPRLRNVLSGWVNEIGGYELHRKLRLLDPRAAEAIDATNIRRTIRALEVIFHTGRRFSSQRLQGEPRYSVLKIGLRRSRVELYERIDARIESMMKKGLVTEVQELLAKGYSHELPAFSGIGYREIISHLLGKISLEEAIVLIKRHTRQFVRRQANWFKESDPNIHWFHMNAQTIIELTDLIEAGRGFSSIK